ncbi:MAG: hypothetical protein ABSA53_08900 [Streptosporangiaceae bacterium]
MAGSKLARSAADIAAQCWCAMTSTARPIRPAAKTSMTQAVERTLRSLSHSIRAAERRP